MITKLWRWGTKTFIPYALPGFIILALAKAGALLQNNLFIFAMIVAICITIGLVAFDKLKEPYYPHLVGAIGFALLLQTTLFSPGLIGADIHTEYYFYYKALDGWDYTLLHPYNSAIGTVVIAPFLTNIFHIPGMFIFKFMLPLLFAFVPFLLYFIFKKEFGAKPAFFASIFFVIVPTWSLELTGIPRQMFGETLLVLCLFLILVSKWRLRVRVPLLIAVGILGALGHYIIGPMLVLLLGASSLFLLFIKRRVFPLKWLSLATGIILLSSTIYYGTVSQGLPLVCLTTGTKIVQNLVISLLPSTFTNWKLDVEVPEYPYINIEPIEPGIERIVEEDGRIIVKPKDPEIVEAEDTNSLLKYITSFSPLVQTAWGADFMKVDIWGKAFRVFQYLTQLAIIIGFAYLIKNRKRYSAEYLSLCITSALLLSASVFIPHFAAIINATRFYHFALLLLAPTLVLGGKIIFRNFKLLTVCLIIPYFLFTSGLVFEVTKQTDISQVNMPYAVSLSNHRVDLVGVFTDNDTAVRDWIVANNLYSETYVDTHTQLLLWETGYTYWRDFKTALETGDFVSGKYIFLSERNNRDRTIIHRPYVDGSSSGRRVRLAYEEVGLDEVIAAGKIIYRQGNAFILELNNDAHRAN